MFDSKTETLSKQPVLLIEDTPMDAHVVQGILSEAIGASFILNRRAISPSAWSSS